MNVSQSFQFVIILIMKVTSVRNVFGRNSKRNKEQREKKTSDVGQHHGEKNIH